MGGGGVELVSVEMGGWVDGLVDGMMDWWMGR